MKHESIEILRFTTAGSVDDGKSTLIGRLLFDSKAVFEDQLLAIEKTSERKQQDKVNLALLTDGLAAEREQGITIDVAYRYFSTPKRKFIIADTPGHEQYTRNMVTGASTADLALILIDAEKGVVDQTRRHLYIAHLLGIHHVFVCVNKMDLVGFKETRFLEIKKECDELVKSLPIQDLRYFPISALNGDNVVEPSLSMSWWKENPLLSQLETVSVFQDQNAQVFRFPVQYVNRPDSNFRGFSGQIVSGAVQLGDEVCSLPSGLKTKIKAISTFDGDLSEAFAPQSVTLVFEDEIDTSRGDVIVKVGEEARVSKEFEAKVCWMASEPLEPRKKYLIKQGTRLLKTMVSAIDHRVDINNYNHLKTDHLALNEVGLVQFKCATPLVIDSYQSCPGTGSFILIDELSNNTVAAGMIV